MQIQGVPVPLLVTMAVIVLATIVIRRRGSTPPLPGALSWRGSVALDKGAFAAQDEALRDLGRAFCAGGVYLQQGGDRTPSKLICPPDLPLGIDRQALDAQYTAFKEVIRSKCAHPPTAGEFDRLSAHLTVSPTISVLAAVGVPPMLLQNRFVVSVASDRSLRAFTLGYLGTPIAASRPADKYAPFVLSVASPDLRDSATADPTSLACTVAYSVRVTRHPKIETEIAQEAGHTEMPANT